MSVRHRDGEPDAVEQHQVGQVVADVGDLGGRQLQGAGEGIERGAFVRESLLQMTDAELRCAPFHHR